jgi:hypothetical protein
MKTIDIVVGPTGTTTVQTKGFTGGECREASRFVDQTLGRKTAETLTAEYHQVEQARQDLKSSR